MLKNFCFWRKDILTSHKNYFIVAVITGLYLLTTAYVCTSIYDSEVTNGNWGSVSDILIAIFTGLISWATTLLLVIAAINLNEWKSAKEFDNKLQLISKISLFYLKRFHLRLSEVKIFQLVQDSDNLKKGESKLYLKGYEEAVIKLNAEDIEVERSNAKSLKIELNTIEQDIYHLIANVNTEIVDNIHDFIHACKKNRFKFRANLNADYVSISESLLGSARQLPLIREPKILEQFSSYKSLAEFLAQKHKGINIGK